MEYGKFQGLKRCFQFVTKGYDVDGVMSELVNYKRPSYYESEGFSDTLSETAEIYAKSTRTMLRTISLLKLSSKELSAPAHPVSIAMKKMQGIPAICILSRGWINEGEGK